MGSQCRLPHLVDAVVHRQSWILFTILPLLPLMTYRAEMLALAAERGITLCALDLEDYDELYLALTKGTDTVQPMTDLELDLLTTKGLKGVRSLLAPHSRVVAWSRPSLAHAFRTETLFSRARHSTSTCMDYVYYVTYVTYVTSSGDTGGSHAQIFA